MSKRSFYTIVSPRTGRRIQKRYEARKNEVLQDRVMRELRALVGSYTIVK